MTIEILSTQTDTETNTRTTDIVITDGGNSYLWAVGGLPLEVNLQTILDAREIELLAAAIAAEVEANIPEIQERRDFSGLEADIANELTYINTTLGTIDTMTAAQVRDVVKRILLEQRAELRAWRFVIRRLG
jgi:hypothetical protein